MRLWFQKKRKPGCDGSGWQMLMGEYVGDCPGCEECSRHYGTSDRPMTRAEYNAGREGQTSSQNAGIRAALEDGS